MANCKGQRDKNLQNHWKIKGLQDVRTAWASSVVQG